MRLSYDETARIADSLGRLLKAGVSSDRIFRVLLRHHRSRRAREGLAGVARTVRLGGTFYDGFRTHPRIWPRYFIELVRCAEISGHLYAGFEESADHFRMVARVWRAAHMLWMGPLAIVAFGWVVRALLWTWFIGPGRGLMFCESVLISALPPAAFALAFVSLPPLRRIADGAILQLPVLSETVRDLSVYQFTTCFQYLYCSAVSAPEIVRLAANAMGNTHLRGRVASAADEVAGGARFAEALRGKTHWPKDYIEQLSHAELSGQLELVLATLARERKEALELRVQLVRSLVERIVGYAVITAIVFTMLAIFTERQRAGS